MPGLLAAYVRAVDTLSAFSGRLAGWMFFAVGLFVTYEVFMRYVLTLPTVWVDEISRILQIWATYLAVAYVLRQRKHILIDITFRDATALARRLVDTFSLVVIILFSVLATVLGWEIWLKSTLAGHTTDSYLAVPKVFIESSIWIGFGLTSAQAVAEIIKTWTGMPVPAPGHDGEA